MVRDPDEYTAVGRRQAAGGRESGRTNGDE